MFFLKLCYYSSLFLEILFHILLLVFPNIGDVACILCFVQQLCIISSIGIELSLLYASLWRGLGLTTPVYAHLKKFGFEACIPLKLLFSMLISCAVVLFSYVCFPG